MSFTALIEVLCLIIYVLSLFMSDYIYVYLALWPALDLTEPSNCYRLFSSSLVHFGILHIGFNLVMWEAIGRSIENSLGWFKLVLLFVLTSLVANLLQYFLMGSNAIFGGLSGVVYGLIGYIAMLSRKPSLPANLRIIPGLFTVSLLFVGFGFFFSGIANFCHLGGLLMGVLLGYIDYKRP